MVSVGHRVTICAWKMVGNILFYYVIRKESFRACYIGQNHLETNDRLFLLKAGAYYKYITQLYCCSFIELSFNSVYEKYARQSYPFILSLSFNLLFVFFAEDAELESSFQ